MSAEQAARQNIDDLLDKAGWHVCDVANADLHAVRGVAIREFPLAPGFGFADYVLYVDGRAAGVIEAKKEGATLTGVEIQSGCYAKGLPAELPAWRRPPPLLYGSTGAETHFTYRLDPEQRGSTSPREFAAQGGWRSEIDPSADRRARISWAITLRQAISQNLDYRDRAVHPSLELGQAHTRSDVPVGVDWKFVAYRYDNALTCFQSTLQMVAFLYERKSGVAQVDDQMEAVIKALEQLGVVSKNHSQSATI